MRERSNSSSQGDVKLQILKQWCVEDYSQNKTQQQMIEKKKTEEFWRGKNNKKCFRLKKQWEEKNRQKRRANQNWKLDGTNINTHTHTQGEVGEMSNRTERRKNWKRTRGGVGLTDMGAARKNEELKKILGCARKEEGFHYFHKLTVICSIFC